MSINPHPSRAATKPQASVSSEKAEQARKLASQAAAARTATVPGPAAAPAQGDKFRMSGDGFFKTLPKAPSAPAAQASASGSGEARPAAWTAELSGLRQMMPAKDRQQPAAGAEAPASSAPKPAALKAGAAEFRLRQMVASQDQQPSGVSVEQASKSPQPEGFGVLANPLAEAQIQQKLKAGNVKPKDFEGIKEGQAGEAVATMINGDQKQRDNLTKLMKDPAFAKHLATALKEMSPEDRSKLLKKVGELPKPTEAEVDNYLKKGIDPDSSKIRKTLSQALDGLPAAQRNEVLGSGLLSQDPAVKAAADSYLKNEPQRAVELLKAAGADPGKLGELVKSMGTDTLRGALDAMATGPDQDAREVFRHLGNAVSSGKVEGLGAKMNQALDGMNEYRRTDLLMKIVRDPAGSRASEAQSPGKSLVAGYLESKGPQGFKQFLDSVANPNWQPPALDPSRPWTVQQNERHKAGLQARGELGEFMMKNAKNEDLRRVGISAAAEGPPKAEVNSGRDEILHTLNQAMNAPPQERAAALLAAAKYMKDPPNLSFTNRVRELIISLKDHPAELERALKGMGGNYQERKAALTEMVSGCRNNFDQVADLLNAVATIGNPELKAATFEAAMGRLGPLYEAHGEGDSNYEKREHKTYRNALTALINSDVNGVIGTLEGKDPDGKAILPYMKMMLKGNQTEAIGGMIAKLKGGNNLDEDAIRRFGSTEPSPDGGSPYHKNAQDLGYIAGAIHGATKAITGDMDKQAAMLQTIFGAVLGAVGAINPVTGAISAVTGGLSNTGIAAVNDDLKNGRIELADALKRLTYPKNENGDPYQGSAETAYGEVVGRFKD